MFAVPAWRGLHINHLPVWPCCCPVHSSEKGFEPSHKDNPGGEETGNPGFILYADYWFHTSLPVRLGCFKIQGRQRYPKQIQLIMTSVPQMALSANWCIKIILHTLAYSIHFIPHKGRTYSQCCQKKNPLLTVSNQTSKMLNIPFCQVFKHHAHKGLQEFFNSANLLLAIIC